MLVKDGNAILTVGCVHCFTKYTLIVPLAGLQAWIDGKLIQDALPDLSADDRELLISHTCGKCWDYFFGNHENELDSDE